MTMLHSRLTGTSKWALRKHNLNSRRVPCSASKTTRGRSGDANTISSSSSERPRQPAAQNTSRRKALQDHVRGWQGKVTSIFDHLTPQREGDLGDVLMIGMSMAVFIYLAMQMYRLYYYVYLQLGVLDMMA